MLPVSKFIHRDRQMSREFRAGIHIPIILRQHIDIVKYKAHIRQRAQQKFIFQNCVKRCVHDGTFIESVVSNLYKMRIDSIVVVRQRVMVL